MSIKVIAVRVLHGLFATYFLMCLAYLYYSAISNHFAATLLVAVTSLVVEGFVVFVLNEGDCPLIHVQRRVGDEKPFFEIFFPAAIAKRAIPVFAVLTWVGVGLLLVRVILRLR